MKNRFRFVLQLIIGSLFICTQLLNSQTIEKTPRLVVNIVLKDVQSNQITAFYDRLGEKGLKTILKNGTYYPNATYDHLATYEGGNLATIITGAQPSVHGLIGGSWYNPIKGNQEWALGLDLTTINDPSAFCKLSSNQILSSTVSDELRLVHGLQSKIGSIGVDLNEAIIGGGHTAQSVYWYNTNGKMVSNLCPPDSLPTWANDFNNKKFGEMYAARWWGPMYDLNTYHEYLYPSQISGANTNRNFLYNISQMAVGDKVTNYIKGSPYINTIIRDFAVNMMVNDNYGKDAITDMLTISFATKPRVRPNVSLLDAETEDMILKLDQDIETLLTFLNEWVGKDKYLITLTSTGGTAREPNELSAYKIPTGVFSGRKATSLLSLYLMALYGQNKWIKNYQDGNFYLDKELFEKNSINFEEIKSKCAQFLMQISGVSIAITNTELNNTVFQEGEKLKIQRSFHPVRSGDILISLQPGWVEEFEIKGSEMIRFSSNDQYIPLCFYGWNVAKQEVIQPVSVTSLAPTLSLLLRINKPNGCVSSGLKEVFAK